MSMVWMKNLYWGKVRVKEVFSDLCEEEIGNCLSFTLDTILNVESKMKEIIKEQEMLDLYYNVELPLVEVLGSMEYYGFKIDTDELKKLGKEYDEEINSLTTDIYTLADVEFNINSPKQLGEILFDKLSLPIVKKTKNWIFN